MVYQVPFFSLSLSLSWFDSPSGLSPSHRGIFEISLIHTTFVRASLDRDNTHKRGTSMPPAAFEPAILAKRGAAVLRPNTAPGTRSQQFYQ